MRKLNYLDHISLLTSPNGTAVKNDNHLPSTLSNEYSKDLLSIKKKKKKKAQRNAINRDFVGMC